MSFASMVFVAIAPAPCFFVVFIFIKTRTELRPDFHFSLSIAFSFLRRGAFGVFEGTAFFFDRYDFSTCR
jgi:hypothetical protein